MRIDGRKLLGLPRNASSEEIEERCEDLLDWLESADVPDELHSWLHEQQTLLRGLSEHPNLVDEAPPVQTSQAKASQRGMVESPKSAKKANVISWLMARPMALALIGAIAGLAVLSAILLSGVLDSGGNQPASDTSGLTAAEKAANQAQISKLEEVIKADPKNTQTLFDLGELNISNGNWAESIKWFTQLLAVEPTNLHAQLDVGIANLQLGNYPQAYDGISKVLAIDPENVSAHYNMGFLQAFRSDGPDLAGAAKHFEEVIRLAPGSEQAKVAVVHLDQIKAELGTAPKN